MELRITGEIKDGAIELDGRDAAALVAGRLTMAWAELDYKIENLLHWAWKEVQYRNKISGKPVEPPIMEGRAEHRMKALRRTFVILCVEDEDALSEIDRLLGAIRELEKMRSSFAHGITVGTERDGELTLGAVIYSDTKEQDIKTRTVTTRLFKLSEMIAATENIRSVCKDLEDLVGSYVREFIQGHLAQMTMNRKKMIRK